MNALTLSAPRRRDQVVILSGFQFPDVLTPQPLAAMRSALASLRRCCTVRRAVTLATALGAAAGYVGFLADSTTVMAAAAAVVTTAIFIVEPLAKKGGAL